MCVYKYIYIFIHTHTYTTHTMEYYPAIKKNEMSPFVTTWIDLESSMLRKMSDRER